MMNGILSFGVENGKVVAFIHDGSDLSPRKADMDVEQALRKLQELKKTIRRLSLTRCGKEG